MELDFKTDTGKINNKQFNLDSFRQYLINNRPELVKKNYVKTILKNGYNVRTYDWDNIFWIAKNDADLVTDFTNDYLT